MARGCQWQAQDVPQPPAEAPPLLERALRLKPKFARAENTWGVALAMLGRRDEATRIRRKLGRPAFKLEPHHEIYRNPDYTRRIGQIEAAQGERAPPTPEYMAAKARAEALMAA